MVIATCLLLVAFVAVAVRLAMYIQHTLLIVSLGALFAYALEPLVSMLRYGPMLRLSTDPETGRRRIIALRPDPEHQRASMPRGMAITIVIVGLFILIGLVGYGLEHPLAKQIHLLSDKRIQQIYKARAIDFLGDLDTKLGHLGVHTSLAGYLQDPSTIPPNVLSGVAEVEKQAIPVVRDLVVAIGEGVFVLLIAIYLLVYGSELRERLNSKLPPNLLRHAEVWEEDINRILGGFVRGQLTIALVMGFGAAMACFLVGIHFWLLIGLFVVVVSFIPVFGPYIGAVPAVVLALIAPTHFHNSIVAAIVIICLFVLINELGSKVLYPRLVGQAIGLHEVLVLFAIIAGLEIDGVVGVLFAAPFTAMVLVTIVHLYRFWQELPESLLSRPVAAIREVAGERSVALDRTDERTGITKPLAGASSSAEPAPSSKA